MEAKTAHLPARIRAHARELRHHQTDAETKLWYFLRNRAFGGFKFRRQHPIKLPSGSMFILDFYCYQSKLAVELDGGQHVENKRSDERRTAQLEQQGISVIRFWNDDVLLRTDAILEVIWKTLHGSDSLTPQPPLPKGEGE